MLGLWLNSFFAATIVGRSQDPRLLFAALVGGAALVLWLVRGRPAKFVISPAMTLAILLLISSVVVGYALNLNHYSVSFMLANFVSMLVAFVIAYLVVTRLELDFARLLVWHSAFAMLLLPIPVLTGELVWGRLVSSDVHPNLVGMIALVAFIGALEIRSRVLKLLVVCATLGVIYVVSSRASLVAAAIAAACYGWCRAVRPMPVAATAQSTRWSGMVVLFLGLTLVVLYAGGVDWVQQTLDSLLKVNDPHRGLDSGASGRTEIWAAAIARWEKHPIFGVGFKGHASFMPDGLAAHSAYLGILADAGAVGFIGYLLMCGIALFGLLARGYQAGRDISLALVVSYLIYGLVETRGFGFGNPYSILFLWIAFDASRRPALHTARRQAAPQATAAGAPTRTLESAR